MAVVPVCYKISSCNDRAFPIERGIRQSGRSFTCDCIAIQDGSRRSSSFSVGKDRRWSVFRRIIPKVPVLHNVCSTKSNLQSTLWYASVSSTNEEQLRSLDSYFRKLQNEPNQHSSDSSSRITELINQSGQTKSKTGLTSLEDYLGKLNKDVKSECYAPPTLDKETTKGKSLAGRLSTDKYSKQGDVGKLKGYIKFRNKGGETVPEISQLPLQYNETFDLYLISILASLNIAVFLFDIASPIKNSDLEVFSLPLIYGAKINHLIVVGEWWRLVTPMFLHSGLLHVALSSWALLTFGPQVCRVYGSFTFFLIYVLGGISGNLISFLHTAEPTVGGTGPVFALIGAWVIYQIQNKDVVAKTVSESMFQKAIITTALSFMLSNFGPIDDWSHYGAAFTGIAYGFFTCPMLQLDDTSTETGKEEGIAFVKQYADPCKSLFVFTVFTLVLSSLLLFIEPPLNMQTSSSFLLN